MRIKILHLLSSPLIPLQSGSSAVEAPQRGASILATNQKGTSVVETPQNGISETTYPPLMGARGRLACSCLSVVLIFSILFISFGRAHTQDFSYTQVFAHSSTVSPALTGLHNGQFKASLLYRNQWVRAVEKPFTMAGGYVDLRSKLPFKITSKDAFGIGLGFVSENQGVIEYKKNSFNINAAYHKALDYQGENILSVGAQMGFLQNSVGYENITFMDQFDGTGFNLSTSEDLPANSINSLDFGLGIHYQFVRNEDMASAGISMFHINSPDISFGNNDETTLDETKNQLYRKYVGHFYYQATVNRDLSLTPRFIAKVQGPNQLAMVGSTARIRLSGQNENAVHFGIILQAGKTFDATFKPHTTSLLIGYEINAFNLGLSYDVGLINRYNFKSNPGNFELSLSYFGFLTDNTVAGCPVF